MKRFYCAVVILMLLCGMTACGNRTGNSDSTALAETAVKQAVIRFQEGDSAYILRIMGLNQAPFLEYCSEEEADRMAQAIFNQLEGKILSSKQENDNTVTVETQLTMTDYSGLETDIVRDTARHTLSALLSDGLKEEQLAADVLASLKQRVSGRNKQTKTETILITVKKQGGGWEILGTTETRNALTGGLYALFSDLLEQE